MTNLNAMNDVSEYSSIPLAQTIVSFCQEKHIRHIVISPGSRNAPLTKGFTSNSFFTTYSVVDERSAGFFALGIAQQIQHPVALVCTSGSALLNYYPAVAEAFYSDIPLVVLSADRLPHQIDIGDGQTIRQAEVFEPHLEDAAYLKPDVSHATTTLSKHPKQRLFPPDSTNEEIDQIQFEIQRDNEIAINRVLNTAINSKGPVHLNAPFEEPLYETTNKALKISNCSSPVSTDIKTDLEDFQQFWNTSEKKLVLVGVLPPNSIQDEIIKNFIDDPSVVIMTEKTSNVKTSSGITSIDTFIAPIEKEKELLAKFKPDILVTFGGMIVSKKIKAFLRNYPAKKHYHIDPKKAYDTFYYLTSHLKISINDAFGFTLKEHFTPVESNFKQRLQNQYISNVRKGIEYLNKIPFSDLKVFDRIARAIPKGVYLHLGNSSTIRYAQLVDLPPLKGIFCNRGTSGIDGSTSTAIGAAWLKDDMTVFISGDLSFYYDSNALWNNYLKPNLRIIIINNQGGGIFRILPGEKDTPAYDRYFETVQKRSAKYICKDHGLSYTYVSSDFGLKIALKSFFKSSSRPKVLEIGTPRTKNDQILLNYFKAMQQL